jgi:Rieske Fe-S protein
MEPNHACPAAKPEEGKVPRRRLLGWLVGVFNLGVFASVLGPTLGFVSAPMRRKTAPPGWVPVLDHDALRDGETRSVDYRMDLDDGYMTSKVSFSVFLHRRDGEVMAFDPTCPHLGCHVEFKDAKDRYVCPCHGGVFNNEGGRVSGPPPHGLNRLPVKVEDGRIWIQRV